MAAGSGLERVKGIEPSYAAWEAAVLPLNYTRETEIFQQIWGQFGAAKSIKRLNRGNHRLFGYFSRYRLHAFENNVDITNHVHVEPHNLKNLKN